MSAAGILVYQTGQDEHKVDVPVNLLRESPSSFTALQRPSSVGIRPVKYLIERLSANGLLVYQSINLSKNVLTGQFVVVQPERAQCRAEAEFRRNVACAARRSFFEVGILGSQTGQDEHKIDVPVSWLHAK